MKMAARADNSTPPLPSFLPSSSSSSFQLPLSDPLNVHRRIAAAAVATVDIEGGRAAAAMEVVAPTRATEVAEFHRLDGAGAGDMKEPFDYFYHYTSAPTSPTRAAAAIYGHFKSSSDIPAGRREVGGGDDDMFDFTFFSGPLEKGGPSPPPPIPADELFEAWKIQPLRLPPRLQIQPTSPPPLSPRSPKRLPRGSGEDPFAIALANVAKERGRERAVAPRDPPSPSIFPYSSSRAPRQRRRGTRSLSPFREDVVDVGVGVGVDVTTSACCGAGSSTTRNCIANFFRKRTNNWRLRDLLLFRSASEGRASGAACRKVGDDDDDRLLLRKYSSSLSPSTMTSPGGVKSSRPERWADVIVDDSRGSSFRSIDSVGGGGDSGRGRRSLHETHYAASRAAADELRRKTPLPYRQGVFSFLRDNPALQAVSRSFNSGAATAATRTRSFPS